MIRFDSLRHSVYAAINKQDFTAAGEDMEINKIIASCLLLTTARKLLSNAENYQDGISSLLDSYAGTYKGIVNNLSEKYVSYKYMKKEVKSWRVPNFLSVNQKQIDTIVNIYDKKKEKVDFSCNKYTQTMYNVMDLNYTQNQRLSKIHFNVIVPIVTYFKELYGIKDKDVTIEDTSEGMLAGKVLLIAINNIELRQILSCIDKNTLKLNQYIYSANIVSNGFVKIVLR